MHQSFKLFKTSILAALLLLMLTATALAAPAEITSSVHPQYPDINIPVVTIPDNPEATDAINAAIKQNIDTFIAQTAEIRDTGEEWNRVYLGNNYTVACNDGSILSIVCRQYVNIERAAHPMHYVHGLNFNTQSGDRITIDALNEAAREKYGRPAYTAEAVTCILKNRTETEENFVLYDSSLPLSSLPKQFYLDEKKHVHFLFQPYEIAPYSSGVIDVDMDAKADNISHK